MGNKMRNIIMFIFVCFTIYCKKSFSQSQSIDSILLVSYDANYRYMDDFDGTPYVSFLKELLDKKKFGLERVDIKDDEENQIKYRCIINQRSLLNKFEKLLSKCDTSSYMDLSNFSRIKVRIGLKIYKGNIVEYMFIQPKGSDYFDKFIITETKELHASNNLIRFLKRMRNSKRCQRC